MGEAVFSVRMSFLLPPQDDIKKFRMNFNEVIFGSQHWFEDDTKLSRNRVLVYRNCLIQINKVGIVAKGLRFWLEGKL